MCCPARSVGLDSNNLKSELCKAALCDLTIMGVTVVTIITLLVLSVLGAKGIVPMAPVGPRIMLGLSLTAIFCMLVGVAKHLRLFNCDYLVEKSKGVATIVFSI